MSEEYRPSKVRKLNGEGQSERSSPQLENGSNPNLMASETGVSQKDQSENEKKTLKENTEASSDHQDPGHVPSATTAEGETKKAQQQFFDDAGNPISKNQAKKLRKKAEWEAGREDRKVIRKEKMTARKERKRAARDSAAPPQPEAVKAKAQRSVQLPITFLLDCDFDDLMRDNERISLASQITRCYSDNKNSLFRAHLTVCSFGGQLRKRFDTILTHYTGWRGVRFLDEDFILASEMAKGWMLGEGGRKGNDKENETKKDALDGSEQTVAAGTIEANTATEGTKPDSADKAKSNSETQTQSQQSRKLETEGGQFKGVFSKYADLSDADKKKLQEDGEVVYLTSDSPHTLTEMKPYSTYIIGGLVDKNREKGICYKRACEAAEKCKVEGRKMEIKTAKLPIGEYLEMSSRKVLATNHVNEIMLKWLECGDWGEAFMRVIPKRKGGKLREEEEKAAQENAEEGEAGLEDEGLDEGNDEVVEEAGETGHHEA
ncbi:hypothetical protein KC332_g5029 [Hortaea werneckii]|uniref:tRNA (guanine(9)-N1)-methyltransferase n=2 Tax=Hortaea werneckii TaxID=91943 RepID=A0A3M7IIH9_HORWE|nr:hypothetical protein KC350_g3998 [Hortaea werneckii]OTA38588.1 hypothetical protein BTJ68_01351 [Hortaea werneckii EXF-2000]KAI6847607.1 hypothetical protein KC358_g2229 [Hortaea werneckii]KAI6942448.1 hypothetical protein KC341_g2227 [Hortaea werneckii]KAI6948141.1 hypothetical protein KC348_g2102 [Hortaea werneckii]